MYGCMCVSFIYFTLSRHNLCDWKSRKNGEESKQNRTHGKIKKCFLFFFFFLLFLIQFLNGQYGTGRERERGKERGEQN